MKTKFCDYIKQIKEEKDFDDYRGQGHLFIRKDVSMLEFIKRISGKKVFTIEIGYNGIMEEVEWSIDDTDIIYPIFQWYLLNISEKRYKKNRVK